MAAARPQSGFNPPPQQGYTYVPSVKSIQDIFPDESVQSVYALNRGKEKEMHEILEKEGVNKYNRPNRLLSEGRITGRTTGKPTHLHVVHNNLDEDLQYDEEHTGEYFN
jgi:hypothetical protein